MPLKINSINQEIGLNRGAENVNAGIFLHRKLSGLQKAQQTNIRTHVLLDGRIRYYNTERPATFPGPTRGGGYVTEWDPKTAGVRSWYECRNHFGDINLIHPKQYNGQNINAPHYPQ